MPVTFSSQRVKQSFAIMLLKWKYEWYSFCSWLKRQGMSLGIKLQMHDHS